LRIISGKLRGRKLCTLSPDEQSIRPTSDRAREALFSIIGDDVRDARVLDLFAGTGAFGLEACSRGAAYIVFVENGTPALKLLKKNITLLFRNTPLDTEIRVVAGDLSSDTWLSRLPAECCSDYGIVFADPPYDRGLSVSVLEQINKGRLLHKNGLLIIEERHTVTLPERLSNLVQTDRRTYGEAAFSFYHNQNN
jgi:16S rRNA (guanine966-N2)-methyltransferase